MVAGEDLNLLPVNDLITKKLWNILRFQVVVVTESSSLTAKKPKLFSINTDIRLNHLANLNNFNKVKYNLIIKFTN